MLENIIQRFARASMAVVGHSKFVTVCVLFKYIIDYHTAELFIAARSVTE